MVSAQIFKAKKQALRIFHLHVISIFLLFFILEWSTLSVELNFTTIALFLAKLADFSCSNMA